MDRFGQLSRKRGDPSPITDKLILVWGRFVV